MLFTLKAKTSKLKEKLKVSAKQETRFADYGSNKKDNGLNLLDLPVHYKQVERGPRKRMRTG